MVLLELPATDGEAAAAGRRGAEVLMVLAAGCLVLDAAAAGAADGAVRCPIVWHTEQSEPA